MNTTENNKLIANFLSKETCFRDLGDGYLKPLKVYSDKDFAFHKDWNWIMKAVECINLLDDYEYSVTILTMDCYIKNSKMEWIVSIDCKYNPDELINSVYEAVVEFIKWYNQNGKKERNF
jgi:hypothetical protein